MLENKLRIVTFLATRQHVSERIAIRFLGLTLRSVGVVVGSRLSSHSVGGLGDESQVEA